jgi:hypothetical protein
VPLHCTLVARDAEQNLIVEPGRHENGAARCGARRRGRLPLGRITLSSSIRWALARVELHSLSGRRLGLSATGGNAAAAADARLGSSEGTRAPPARRVLGPAPLRARRHAAADRMEGAGARRRDVQQGVRRSSRGRCVLDWNELPAEPRHREKLSRMTAWVLAAERARIDYALSLPGVTSARGHGAAQRASACARSPATRGMARETCESSEPDARRARLARARRAARRRTVAAGIRLPVWLSCLGIGLVLARIALLQRGVAVPRSVWLIPIVIAGGAGDSLAIRLLLRP